MGLFAGVKHLENCPIQPKIPIYMLVGGCFGLLKVFSLLWRQVRLRRYRNTGDMDDDVDAVYNDDDDDDDEGGGAIMSKSSRYTRCTHTCTGLQGGPIKRSPLTKVSINIILNLSLRLDCFRRLEGQRKLS